MYVKRWINSIIGRENLPEQRRPTFFFCKGQKQSKQQCLIKTLVEVINELQTQFYKCFKRCALIEKTLVAVLNELQAAVESNQGFLFF